MSVQNPVSPKVVAATAGAGIGAAVTTMTLWVLGVVAWDSPSSAAAAADAVAAVPAPVSGVIALVIPTVLAAAASYRTPDRHRVTTDELLQLETMRSTGEPGSTG